MITKKRLRSRGRPKEVPGDLKSVNIMVEIGRFKEFKELCEELGVTTSEGIRNLIDKEVEQKNRVGQDVTPIAVAYNSQDEITCNNRQTSIISFFGHCSTVSNAFHQLLNEKPSKQDLDDLDRRYNYLGMHWFR